MPVWNFDGSSTEQAVGANSDVFLYPVALFEDPFRGKPHKMVLCETYSFDDKPTCSNYRKTCKEVMDMEVVQVSYYLVYLSGSLFFSMSYLFRKKNKEDSSHWN